MHPKLFSLVKLLLVLKLVSIDEYQVDHSTTK